MVRCHSLTHSLTHLYRLQPAVRCFNEVLKNLEHLCNVTDQAIVESSNVMLSKSGFVFLYRRVLHFRVYSYLVSNINQLMAYNITWIILLTPYQFISYPQPIYSTTRSFLTLLPSLLCGLKLVKSSWTTSGTSYIPRIHCCVCLVNGARMMRNYTSRRRHESAQRRLQVRVHLCVCMCVIYLCC